MDDDMCRNHAMELIARRLAMPKMYRVTTYYECGKTRTHDTATLAQAENYATGERRAIGRNLICRDTGATVRKIRVSVESLA